ncbi:SgcJ/EcaC family oxidoreductase [Nocardia flavorosea]|uniref:SgcJ/EcaC family oxidoreductase n=1 Tax=Nocardia flavorosea TaxID=53429 RepID=UPI002455F66C|nr:SgcJ/EcaC family oxidoreductase [Nocardia flavorosea]
MRNESGLVVDDETHRAIEALSTEYSWLVDHGHADRAADLFTSDAVMSVAGSEVSGIVAIRRHLEQRARSQDILSRHVVSNIRLTREAAGQVRGTIIMTIYRKTGEAERPQVIIGDVDDVYRLETDGRWRLAQRTLTPAFVVDGR